MTDQEDARRLRPAPSPNRAEDALSTTASTGDGPSKPPAELPRGTTVGRYLILERLGQGGMGIVYEAYDPDLDRKVAIKVMNAPKLAEGVPSQASLLREAQAMARLSHPHVVAIYDLGLFGEGVYIAMERCDGQNLQSWLKSAPRSVEEILQVFLQAGAGLVAAHEVGLVHLDFKPQNVLISRRGFAQVSDFGLSRLAIGSSHDCEEDGAQISDTLSVSSSPSVALAAVGTPAYMAPEQHRGRPLDARADQFAFCVSLFEALHGLRPYFGATPRELLAAIEAGRVYVPPARRDLPRAVRKAILRGLTADPAGRFPTLQALLSVLELKRPSRQRRWLWALTGALVGAATLASVGGWRPAPACAAPGAGLTGAWDASRRAEVQAAFSKSTRPYAPASLGDTLLGLDAYAAEWTQAQARICAARSAGPREDTARWDEQLLCLSRRAQQLRALTGLLAQADEPVILHAPVSTRGLRRIADCESPSLAALEPPSPPVEKLAAVDSERGRLAQARALIESGRHAEGGTLASSVERAARGLAYAPLVAEARYWVGRGHERAGELEAAQQELADAALIAAGARHDRLAAEAWTARVATVGHSLFNPEEGLRDARQAAAMIERLGGDDELTAALEANLGSLWMGSGDARKAISHLERALALCERLHGARSPRLAPALTGLSTAWVRLGQPGKALPLAERALALRQAAFGETHPETAASLASLGSVLHQQGNEARALPLLRLAVSAREQSLGESHPLVASSLALLAASLRGVGDPAGALRQLERARHLRERKPGPELATIQLFEGDCLRELGRVGEAEVSYRAALALRVKTLGANHPDTGAARQRLGELLLTRGERSGAREELTAAVTVLQAAGESGRLALVAALAALGELELAERAWMPAVADLSKAYLTLETLELTPGVRARVAFLYGRALAESGLDVTRGVELAREALALEPAPESSAAKRRNEELRAWLSRHGG